MKTWQTIRAGSKIVLEKDTEFTSPVSGTISNLKKGTYYIAGFWANACGVNSNRGEYMGNGTAEWFIFPEELTQFKDIA